MENNNTEQQEVSNEKETFRGKEVVDVRPKEEAIKDSVDKNEVEDAELKDTTMFFTVSTMGKGGRPAHLMVRAESALQALMFVEQEMKAPVMGVHVTEYQEYVDAKDYYASQEKSEIIT